jgi:NTP pyrophosphatase (non-canonical NTP hydrolase)
MTALFNSELVKEFNDAMEVERGWEGDIVALRLNLIQEECGELYNEFITPEGEPRDFTDKRKVAKELADILYVVYGAADCFGIPIDAVLREVHRSNMSKLGPDGKPIRRSDGKVLKGPAYSPANLDDIVGED